MHNTSNNQYLSTQHRTINRLIQCSRCHVFSPDQFILLLCDHVFCSSCVNQLKETQDQYDSIKCICGLTTHIKSSANTSFSALQRNSVKSYHKKYKAENLRSPYSNKKERITSELNSFIPEFHSNKSSLLEKSNYRLSSGGHKRNRYQTEEDKQDILSIFSKPNRLSENYNSMNIKKQNNRTLTDQFIKQIQFLQIQYEKEISGLKLVFDKVLSLMEQQYRHITSHLKNLCLEKIVSNISKTQLNMPKIIKQKYETYVGSSVEKINLFLRNFLTSKISYEFKTKKRQSCDLSHFQKQKQRQKQKDIKHGRLQKKGIMKKRNWVIQL